jgi:hypothetical protein
MCPCFIRTTGEFHFSQRIRSGQLTVRAAYSGHDADVRRVLCYYADIPGRSVEPCIEVKTDDWSHHPRILRQSKAKHQESMITLTLGASVQLDLTGAYAGRLQLAAVHGGDLNRRLI